MIDCNITKNYLSEQARMTKSSDVGVCRYGIITTNRKSLYFQGV